MSSSDGSNYHARIVFTLRTRLQQDCGASDFIQSIYGRVFAWPVNEERERQFGCVNASLVQFGNALNHGMTPDQLGDGISGSIAEYWEQMFDVETGCWKDEIREELEIAGSDLLIIDYVELDPVLRGHALGLTAVRRTIEIFGSGCGLVACKPWPLQFTPAFWEMLVFSAADFEDFLEPRPDLAPIMESELKAVIRHLAGNRWPFRLHATYDQTISRALDVYEEVNREVPLDGLHWFFDHCEAVSDRNLERIKKLGGGIAVQNRMAFQGEYFVERYGQQQARRSPPIRQMLEMGIPVGAGTDATRVSSYNPFLSLYWLITGKTVGGLRLYLENNRLSRSEALHPLHRRQQLVLHRKREERAPRSRSTRRFLRAHGGLFFHPGRANQTA